GADSGKPIEQHGEYHHLRHWLQDRPGHAQRRLLVSNADVAQREDPQQLPVLPNLAKILRLEHAVRAQHLLVPISTNGGHRQGNEELSVGSTQSRSWSNEARRTFSAGCGTLAALIPEAEDMQTPRLTVLMPTRNAASYIGEALQSIVGGALPASDVEVLVLDGE